MQRILYSILAAYVIVLTIVFCTLMSRGGTLQDAEPEYDSPEQCDSTVITALHVNSMLYTAEAQSQKTMKYSSNSKMSFNLMGYEKDVNLPFSKTEATIPVTITYKAGIDMKTITKDNISITKYPEDGSDGVIVITLPDPVLVQTAVTVDHENEKMEKEFLARGLDSEKYQQMLRQAKQEAWDEMAPEEARSILETAKVSATEILIPQLRSLGFSKIDIQYRQQLDYTKIEKRNKD